MQTAIRSPLLTRLESFIQRMMEKMVIRFLLPLVDQKKLCHDFKKLFIFNDYAGVKNSFMGALPHFSTCVGVRVPLTPTYVWTRPGCQLLLLNKEPGCIYV